MNMGYRELMQMLVAARKLAGHSVTGPSAVVVKSNERIAAPIWPPPERKSFNAVTAAELFSICMQILYKALIPIQKGQLSANSSAQISRSKVKKVASTISTKYIKRVNYQSDERHIGCQ
jgi:hypothetical protein